LNWLPFIEKEALAPDFADMFAAALSSTCLAVWALMGNAIMSASRDIIPRWVNHRAHAFILSIVLTGFQETFRP